MAKRACQSYERARRAIERLGDYPEAEGLRPIVDRYVRDFNRIDRKWRVETAERETIFEALAALTRTLGLHDQAEAWIDEQRSF